MLALPVYPTPDRNKTGSRANIDTNRKIDPLEGNRYVACDWLNAFTAAG